MSMLRTLTHLRDFMDDTTLKFLPGQLQAGTFILLKQSKSVTDKEGVTHFERPIQVFTATGTWIGEIRQPDWIPDDKD